MCDHYIIVPNKAYERQKSYKPETLRYNMVPCGVCPDCLKSKANQTAFRLKQEAKDSSTAVKWLTLTYSDEHVPYTDSGVMTLNKLNVRNFTKRLSIANWRFYLKNEYGLTDRQFTKLKKEDSELAIEIKGKYQPLKYYQAGEYGSKTDRPHHHMFLFNCLLSIDYLRDQWMYGEIFDGEADMGAYSYTTSYMYKDRFEKRTEKDYFNVKYVAENGKQKPYCSGSKFLGYNWIQDVKNQNYLMSRPEEPFIIDNGYKVAVPRVFRKFLKDTYNFEYKTETIDVYEVLNNYSKKYPYLTMYELIKKYNGDQKLIHSNKVRKIEMRKKHCNL